MSGRPDLDILWQPLRVGGVDLSNRIIVSAHMMAFGTSSDRLLGDRYIDYYEERARGGAGLLITGAQAVAPSGWKAPYFEAWHEEAGPRYRELADAVHRHGSKIFVQNFHSGVQNSGIGDLDTVAETLGPSGVQSPAINRIARAMERQDIEDVVEAFAAAAELHQAAGIDGIELGGGHGYLLSNFLSPHSNRRTDEYGGSVENRCRFVVQVVAEMRRRVGPAFPLGLRMSFDEFIGPGGAQPDDSALLLEELHRHRLLDYFSISGGSYHALWSTILPMTNPDPQPFLEHGARAKEVVKNEVPIAIASGLRTVELAAQALHEGKGDLVAMTRAHMADPFLVKKARSGGVEEIRRCVGANQGCVARQANGGMSTCTVNPAVGREKRFGSSLVTISPTPRLVVVVGGGPAGMKAADTAAENGHRVILHEASDSLGGNMRLAAQLPNRGRWDEVVEDLSGSVVRRGVDVRLGSRVTLDHLRSADADLVVVATGAAYDKSGYSVLRPDRQTIEGFANTTVLDPVDAVATPERAGASTVIVDDFGDAIGIGVALMLARAGTNVQIVSMAPFVGAGAASTLEVPGVMYPLLAQAGVIMRPNTSLQSIADGKATLIDIYAGAAEVVDADSVVVNMLRAPQDDLFLAARDAGLPVVRIGDARAPRYVDEAMFEGMELGFTVERTIAEATQLVHS